MQLSLKALIQREVADGDEYNDLWERSQPTIDQLLTLKARGREVLGDWLQAGVKFCSCVKTGGVGQTADAGCVVGKLMMSALVSPKLS